MSVFTAGLLGLLVGAFTMFILVALGIVKTKK